MNAVSPDPPAVRTRFRKTQLDAQEAAARTKLGF